MRIKLFVAAAALAALPASGLQAQYFSSFSGPTQSGSPFWDQTSQDNGAGCNIGYVLTGQTGPYPICENYKIRAGYTAPYSTIPASAWYAHANGNINQSVGFGFFAGSSGATLTYWGGIAGSNPLRNLVVRDLNTNSLLHTFDITDSTSWSWTSSANTLFDLGIVTYTPGSTFYSWTAVNPNQFAAFGDGATFGGGAYCGTSCWVGAEDVVAGRPLGDYDYQDGVLQISGAGISMVPEPSSIVLMASGLVGLAVASRRRRKNC